MKILVVGAGAREHALAWALARSPQRPDLFAAPGNPGMAKLATLVPVDAGDVEGLVAFAARAKVDVVVVGPEAPLVAGLGERLRAAGVAVFGPDSTGARLEGSKAFAKEIMAQVGIPTARHAVFTDVRAARRYVERHGAPVVVKADGLAAGKGVVVARTLAEAYRALDDLMERRVFGAAGAQVVVEEYLEGDELSVMAIVSSQTYTVLPPSQDHKQVYDFDQGPNTGGMGAYAPVPWAGDALLDAVRERIFTPLLAELVRKGIDYRGVIYAGLMVTAEGPQVIEFNARFGDPEAQVTLPLIAGDLAEILAACAAGTLERQSVRMRPGAAVGVTLAADGYPGPYTSGYPISGLGEDDPDTLIFHAGTRIGDGGEILTGGGRVLTVVGLGGDVASARARAYSRVERVGFAGMHYRRDIGQRPRRTPLT